MDSIRKADAVLFHSLYRTIGEWVFLAKYKKFKGLARLYEIMKDKELTTLVFNAFKPITPDI
ncbi:hypothetical protein DQG13_18625 [Paenibacillus sp. YN15]|nr:hypothetical protein DQG13_18625 [Paenibacillus sp. YN15]